MVLRRRILIEIPEKDLIRELGWFRDGMGENAVRTYLLKNPHTIETGLKLENFVGISVWFTSYDEKGLVKDSKEADMFFRRNGTYYIVETKQKGKYYRGWQYVRLTIECFEADMKKHNQEIPEVVAVLATSSETVQSLNSQPLDWFE